MKKFARLAALLAAMSANALALDLGVNIHSGGGDAARNEQFASVMKQRNFTTARMDMFWNNDQAQLRDQVQRIRANGGNVEVVLMTTYQWDGKCNQNLAWVEQDAYNQTAGAVNKTKDIVHDYEILNEPQLFPWIRAEVPWNSAGTSATPYYGKPCMATLAAALRGMSRAIRDIRASSGQPLRVILGGLGRDFGFLTFMQQNGVVWDVTGYHNYPHFHSASLLSDPWYGPGGPLYQLSLFKKPVRLNEFNCGEIYDAGYENRAGASVTETCLKAVDRHLTELRSQSIVNLESITFYELLDAPSKAVPENRFGLMYDISRPKTSLYLAAAFAGGTLTAQERYEITSRGLLTDAEIDAMRTASAGGSVTPPRSTVPSDTEAPLVGISSPANGSVFNRRSTIWATAVASDNVAVKEVRFTLDGSTCVSTSAPYQCQFRLPNKRGWAGTLEAQAVDTSGNIGRHSIRISTN
jgi:hypothetical protein